MFRKMFVKGLLRIGRARWVIDTKSGNPGFTLFGVTVGYRMNGYEEDRFDILDPKSRSNDLFRYTEKGELRRLPK